MRVNRTVCIFLAFAWLAACADSPEDRYQAAFEAGKVAKKARKKQKDERLEDYLLFFTQASAELLRSADRVGQRVSSLSYVNDVRSILPKAKFKKVDVRGNLAILTMDGPKGTFEVMMLQEKGNWVIDLFSLKSFWKPIAALEGS